MTPSLLRTVAFGVLVVGLLFKIQQWPGANVLLIVAWGLALVAMVARPLIGKTIVFKEATRDILTLGLLSVIVMRTLHLPGKGFAFGLTVLGAMGLLWFERDRIFPGKGDRGALPWLFYPALVLIIAGALFRIQHWPNSTAMILVGLALGAVWFFASLRADRES